jgi:dolichol-phosphate mannosyltransferase
VRIVRLLSVTARGAAFGVAITRLARAAQQPAPLAAGAADDISVIIPARNEERRLTPLLRALRAAPGVREVIVVDDNSTDGTAALAAAHEVRLISGEPLPTGWAGKAWALQQGIDAALGSWIVTLDADTRPSPLLPSSVVARLQGDDAHFATVAGAFECPTHGAAWLHPAMLTTLVYRYGPPGCQRGASRLMANGQCMVFPNNGGVSLHAVRGEVVEDIALARSLAAAGKRVAMYDGGGLLTTRMFESFADTWQGWGRSLSLPGVEPNSRRLSDLAVVALAQALPVPRLLSRRGDLIDLAAALARIGTLVGTRRAYPAAKWAYWLSPLADVPATIAMARGIVSRRHEWRGRVY